MNPEQLKRTSKFLSLVLRHEPQRIGIQPDTNGWIAVDELLRAMSRHNWRMTIEQLQEVVRENDKQRFSFDERGQKIRANQGHSIRVELGYEPAVPPAMLFHGTPDRFVGSICREGLKKQQRHHVHLHVDKGTSMNVGRRRGRPVLLVIEAGRMHDDGHVFHVTPNNVWLTDSVPPEYIRLHGI